MLASDMGSFREPFAATTRLVRAAAAAVLATALLAAGPALAEGHGHGRGGGDRGYGEPRGGGHWVYAPPPEAYGRFPPAHARQPPPAYGLRRGGMVPPQYREAIVPDYRRHRLRAPPPGFAWVRMGGRYMLVSRATGQIFDVIGD